MNFDSLKTAAFRLFVVALMVFALGPLVWCVVMSTEGLREANSAFAVIVPTRLHFENYWRVLANSRWVSGFFNSLGIALLGVAINLIISPPAAFAMARVRFPMKKALSWLTMLLVFMPINLLVVPVRNGFRAMGLTHTWWSVALPLSAQVFSVLILRSFYRGFPHSIDDCAELMGMGPARCFLRVYLPMSFRPILYTSITQFITLWNCAFLPMFMYRDSGGMVTVQMALTQYAMDTRHIYIGMAATLLACLPCWALFLLRGSSKQTLQVNFIDPFRKQP